ncbi:MAG: NAD(P)H-binding protein [Thermoanaerobaculia bacterium]
MAAHCVFVTGGTGYIGRRLIPTLLRAGHAVTALVRPGSESRLPAGCVPVVGNALDASSFTGSVPPADTFVQLVGVAHPGPTKAAQFESVDFACAAASAQAAAEAGIRHFVYVSVAQPAPAMRAYVAARARGEARIREKGLDATFLRPWYVLGSGHRWPYFLVPAYWIAERIPSTRETARRCGLVTLAQMVAALLRAVEEPPQGVRIVEVPEIRRA